MSTEDRCEVCGGWDATVERDALRQVVLNETLLWAAVYGDPVVTDNELAMQIANLHRRCKEAEQKALPTVDYAMVEKAYQSIKVEWYEEVNRRVVKAALTAALAPEESAP